MLRAGQAGQVWSAWELPGPGRGTAVDPAMVLAACVWCRAGVTPTLALPVWSATPCHLETLALTVGPA